MRQKGRKICLKGVKKMFFLVCLYLFPINNGFLFSDCGSYMLCAKWFSSLGLAACPNVCNLSNTNLL